MKKHNGMRPQDVVVLLKIITMEGQEWVFADIARALQLSESEVSYTMERNKIAGLVGSDKTRVNKLALRDFLIYGLKYVFPPQPGHSARGIATAHSAPPVKDHIAESDDHYVWAYYKGTKRGNTIVPLYDKIPAIVESQPDLYELLTIVDTLRIGKKREIEIAIQELDKRLNGYGNE
ncbi:MAG: hypothetical protein LBM67_06175 [Lentimicrobiaceae bacterium]|jgi:hypothetical protein|nr:hypothetical protein [Lentimicrobiaceae bacterium]